MTEEEFIKRSKENLRRILKAENLLNERLEKAFDRVPREEFFLPQNRSNAYQNNAFEIGFGQTISQPSMVFIMLKKLEVNKSHKVLEIGTGSGYLTALLCELSYFVYSMEIIPELASMAESRLRKLGYKNFSIIIGDGSEGLPTYMPYDRIIVSAACPGIPSPLIEQLADGGILILPVGGLEFQRLVAVKKQGKGTEIKEDITCRFVPLMGKRGFKNEITKNY
ncbi:MAG: protein-L-isoaspartate(D-aspartate) O-methyltransferase [Brevinematia bacterium]